MIADGKNTTSNAASKCEPLAVGIREACDLLGIKRSTLYREISAGRLLPVKAGKRTLLPTSELRRWLAGLPIAATGGRS
ncbi:MAG: helix-turn-helix domain-containing protein [Rhodospirillaceae bacterium]